MVVSLALAAVLVQLGACARTLPAQPSQAALFRDLQRLVAVSSAAGWKIDRLEIAGLLPDALMSVCRVAPDERRALEQWLDDRITALGGPVDVAYRSRGRKLSKVKKLLELTRIRDTLRMAQTSANDDCPFWLEPKEKFAGRQISDDRWQISVGGGGRGNLVQQAGERDLQFGGAGRVLLGRGLGSRVSLYSGLEIAGSASVPRGAGGDRTNLIIGGQLVVPAVLRYRLVNAYFEFEGGYLAHATEEDWGRVSHGMHLGVAFGGRAARVRWFFPGAVFGIGYDRVNEAAGPRHTIKLGFRVAFDIDL